MTKPRTGFVPLAHLLPADRATQIMKLQINGISDIPEVTRVYPRDWLASQVLGSVHRNGQGASGLEFRYNKQLEGTNGLRTIVNDAIGQPISIDDVRTMQPGKTLKLTIDAALQDEVEQVLAGVGAQYSPKGATAIVMNPNTGAILALANWPRVNANDPGRSAALRQHRSGGRLQLRAGLDLQGDHRRRRAPGRPGHAEHRVQHPAGAPGRRSPDPRRREPRRRDAVGRRDPRSTRATSVPT